MIKVTGNDDSFWRQLLCGFYNVIQYKKVYFTFDEIRVRVGDDSCNDKTREMKNDYFNKVHETFKRFYS